MIQSSNITDNHFLRPAAVGVQHYLASLRSVEHKLSKLRSTNFRVNQEVIAELGHLLHFGNQQLQDLFETMIQEDVKIIEPLYYITKRSFIYMNELALS